MRTFCIITTAANELVGQIHDRMPVILPPGYERWLANIEPDPRDLLVPFPVTTHEDVADQHAGFVLQSGWASSYKELANGRRQVISFPSPGDCVGLRSVQLRTADHSVSALTVRRNLRFRR